MFRRLGRIDADKLLTEYIEDRVFLLLSPALRKLSVQYNDLNPVEVWQEARTVTERLVQFSSRRDVLIDVVYPELLEQYQHFESVDGNIVDRLEEQAKRIAKKWYNANAKIWMKEKTVREHVRSRSGKGEGGRDFCGWSALVSIALPAEMGWL